MLNDHQAGCFSLLRRLTRKNQSKRVTSADDSSLDTTNVLSTSSNVQQPTHALIPLQIHNYKDPSISRFLDMPPHYTTNAIYKPDVLETIEKEVDKLGPTLRDLSLKIHDHPELGFEETYAHDTFTTFMESHGFKVTRHYLELQTAWRAEFEHGKGGRAIGLNSEMDALPGIGHACGHNLVGMIGVAISLGIKAALTKHDIPGKIILLGTPAEEVGAGAGKVILIQRGAYKDMDVCLMAHPGSGSLNTTGTGSSKAIGSITVNYKGQSAHASAAPWEGKNALDAAVVAYTSISALRQQIHPSHRVHGVIKGDNLAANIIPDNARIESMVRAPTREEVENLRDRVVQCYEAAALATGTTHSISIGELLYDLRQNPMLASDYSNVVSKFGIKTIEMEGAMGGSTDFGNVTYELPGLHAAYIIPSTPNGKNHTKAFAEAARTEEAHQTSLSIAKALAHVGLHVIDDDAFYNQVRNTFTKITK